jgi:protein-L-isoaspartate(D-aspartate) O-methyltransferase
MDFTAARSHMLEGQIRVNDVTDPALRAALAATPREVYVPAALVDRAYADAPLEVAPGRFTLRPREMAKLIQALEIVPTDRVAVLASGWGYALALIAHMGAEVVGVEPEAKLADASRKALKAQSVDADVVVADLQALPAKLGTFDVVLVDGAVAEIPAAWDKLLAPGGRMGVIVRTSAAGRAQIRVRGALNVSARDAFDAQAQILPGFEAKPGFVF